MKYCPECGSKVNAQQKFCSACGNSLSAAAETPAKKNNPKSTSNKTSSTPSRSSDQLAKVTERITATSTGAVKKVKKLNKRDRVLLVSAVVALLGIVIAAIVVPKVVEANAIAENKRLAAETLTTAISQKVLNKYLPECTEVETAVAGGIDYARAQSVIDMSSGITDSRTAASVVSANGITSSYYASDLEAGFEDFLSTSFSELMSSEDRAKKAQDSQRQKWSDQWRELVLKKCELADQYQQNIAVLEASDSASAEIVALAATAPWYPEGWYVSPTDQDVAWIWQDSASLSCYSCSIWAITIMTKQGCSSVYAEISITEGGTAVDWTNSTLGAISAGQQGSMEFTSYPYRGGSQGQITEINCYSS